MNKKKLLIQNFTNGLQILYEYFCCGFGLLKLFIYQLIFLTEACSE